MTMLIANFFPMGIPMILPHLLKTSLEILVIFMSNLCQAVLGV